MDLDAWLAGWMDAQGCAVHGVADLQPFKDEGPAVLEGLLDSVDRAIVLGLRLDDSIVDEITNIPTPEYNQLYKSVNVRLDDIAARLVKKITRLGYKARAIPASRIVDDANLLGAISHKALARMAGIGWQGKSLLIITPDHGPRIRLVSVLTDMPLAPGRPVENQCGSCTACADACPVDAIKNVPTTSRYGSREEAVDITACNARIQWLKTVPGLDTGACGVCVKACPRGRSRRPSRHQSPRSSAREPSTDLGGNRL